MKITKQQEEIIINCGVFDYNAAKIANILGVEKEEIEKELKDKNSEFSKLIIKGRDMADYVLDLKLFELAQNGDIKALEKLDQRKRRRNL